MLKIERESGSIKNHYQNKIYDNTIKDNITLISSNFTQDDGTIWILIHFMPKHRNKLSITNKIFIQWCFFYDFAPNLCC